MTKPTPKTIPFEKTLSELEAIVQQLEKGDLSLEQSLKQFEKGIGLARQCQDTLTRAEQKVTLLSDNQSPSDSLLSDE
jgi:exodeoxyribonuclease VII small subunit